MAKQSAPAATIAPDNLLKMYPHCLFRPPERVKRRGRLPRGVVSIFDAGRLPVGSTAEIVPSTKIKRDTEPHENWGKRVLIKHHDPRTAFSVFVDSLDGPLRLDGGGRDVKNIRYRPANLRRLWTGLSENERIRLLKWRAS